MGDELHYYMTENGELIVGATFGLIALYAFLRAAHTALVPYIQARSRRARAAQLPRTEEDR